jgi:outer membrane protein OmpA-like peptidoglycan-associated protein
MLENLSPVSATGKVIATTPAIQYFGNSSDYFRDSRTPEIAELDYSKTPSAILQAKQAVALARYAGADRDAVDELKEAEALLQNADGSWKAGRDEETVDITARKAISAAVKAENTAIVRKEAREKRNERTRADAETRQAEDRLAQAQSEIADLKAQLAAETRNRELTERDSMNYSGQLRELREENGRLREELGKTKVELDNARARVAAVETEKQAIDQQRVQNERVNTIRANQPALIQSLKRFGTVADSEGSVVLTLPETSLWSAVRATTFGTGADARLSGIGELLAANPDYKVTIESHLDDRGTPDELTAITDQRSRAIAERLVSLGVQSERIEAKGLGSSVPVASNTTVSNRAKNRRVRIVLVPTI